MFGIGTLGQMGLLGASLDTYATLRQAAFDAANANNAVLWYVEPDLSNVYADHARSLYEAPLVNGSLVGLLFSMQESAIQVPSGAISSGTWTTTGANAVVADGKITINSSTGEWANASLSGSNVGLLNDAVYEVTITVESVFGNGIRADIGSIAGARITGPGVWRAYYRVDNPNIGLGISRHGGVGGGVVTDVQVRRVSRCGVGNATSANKPSLILDGGRPRLRFNGTTTHLFSRVGSPLGASSFNDASSGTGVRFGDPYTLIAVASRPNVGQNGPRQALCDGRGIGAHDSAWAWSSIHGGVSRWATSAIPADEPRVYGATWSVQNNSLLRQFVGGSQVSTISPAVAPTALNTTATDGGRMFLGSRRNNAEFWQGDIFLACAAPSTLPDDARRAIERFGAFLAGVNYV